MISIRFSPRSLAYPTALLAAYLVALSVSAAPRCEAPASQIDRRACEKAQESPQALRRFIERTQSIYHLQFSDYMSESDLERHRALAAQRARDLTLQAARVQSLEGVPTKR